MLKRLTAKVLIALFVIIVHNGVTYSQNASEQEAREVFKQLVEIAGVSFHEDKVLAKIRGLLPENVLQTVDDRNNLLVTLGSGEPEIMFIAHMDEVGLEVSGINDDGTLSVRTRGGSFSTIWESKVVRIYTESGVVDGIIGPRASYQDQTPVPHSRNDMTVYVGTDSKAETEELGIDVRDYIVQTKRLITLGKHCIAAGSIDDRAGCAAQLLALRRLAGKKLDKTVIFAWVVEEETGLTGSRYLTGTYSPDYVFAVDTFVSSDAPRDNKTMGYNPLGNGAVLRVFDSSVITPLSFVDKIKNIAKNRSIPIQWGITSGSTDGTGFLEVGSLVLPLSWPGIYSHSYVSVIDIRDLTALIDLIVAIAESL